MRLFVNKNVLAMVLIAVVVAVVFLPLLLGKALLHTGLIYTDLWLFNYPIKDLYREMLAAGQLPFWTSLIGNGYPLLAEGQMGALYPLHLILFRIFPTLLAFNLNIMIHYLLAGIFTFLFAREALKLSIRGSLISAFAYMFSGYYVLHVHQININMVVTYLPLSMLLADKLAKGSLKYIPWLGLVFSLQILAGNIEMFYYSVLLTFAYTALVLIFSPGSIGKSNRGSYIKSILGYGLAIALAVGVTFVQLTATFELNRQSQRASGLDLEEAQSSRWPVKTLLLFLHPRYIPIYEVNEEYNPTTIRDAAVTEVYAYIGFLPVILAIGCAVFNRKKHSLIFTLLLAFAFLYGFGRSTQLFTILWETLPGLRFFRYPTKIVFFISFCLAIMAGMGFDYFARKYFSRFRNKKAFYYLTLGVVGLSLADVLLFNEFGTRILVDGQDWLKPPPAAEMLQGRIEPAYNFRLYSHGTNNIDYSWARNYEMQKGFKNILPRDFNMIYRIPNNREWVALFLHRQTQLNGPNTIIDIENKKLLLPKILEHSLSIQAVRYLVSDIPLGNESLTEVAKFPLPHSSDHLFYMKGVAGTDTLRIPTDYIYLYESDDYIPRAYVVHDYETVRDDNRQLAMVFNQEFDPREKVLLEEEVEFEAGSDKTSAESKARVIDDRQNSIEIEADAMGDGFLVLADTYYPGWRAFVDGVETDIYRANYNFRAVAISKGKHKVVMNYQPTSWENGKIVSWLALSLMVLWLVLSVVGIRFWGGRNGI